MNDSKNTQVFDEQNFQQEVLASEQPVVVDFWAGWCAPCRAVAPLIEQLAGQFQGSAKVGKVDVDANPGLAAEYGIRSIPTVLFFKEGKVVDKALGVVPKAVLEEKLQASVSAISAVSR